MRNILSILSTLLLFAVFMACSGKLHSGPAVQKPKGKQTKASGTVSPFTGLDFTWSCFRASVQSSTLAVSRGKAH